MPHILSDNSHNLFAASGFWEYALGLSGLHPSSKPHRYFSATGPSQARPLKRARLLGGVPPLLFGSAYLFNYAAGTFHIQISVFTSPGSTANGFDPDP
jgi:hypothetical protein